MPDFILKHATCPQKKVVESARRHFLFRLDVYWRMGSYRKGLPWQLRYLNYFKPQVAQRRVIRCHCRTSRSGVERSWKDPPPWLFLFCLCFVRHLRPLKVFSL